MENEFIGAFKEMLTALKEYVTEGVVRDELGESTGLIDDFGTLRLERFDELLSQSVESKGSNDTHTIKRARKQLEEFNDEKQPLEWCVQDMRLASERLKKTIEDAGRAIKALQSLVEAQEELIETQERIDKTRDSILAGYEDRARTPA